MVDSRCIYRRQWLDPLGTNIVIMKTQFVEVKTYSVKSAMTHATARESVHVLSSAEATSRKYSYIIMVQQ